MLAISVDVGTVRSTTPPFVYTIGVDRNPVIRYMNGEVLVPYYLVKYDNVTDLVSIFSYIPPYPSDLIVKD